MIEQKYFSLDIRAYFGLACNDVETKAIKMGHVFTEPGTLLPI